MTIKADTDQAKASINALNDAAGRFGSAAASRKSASFGRFRQRGSGTRVNWAFAGRQERGKPTAAVAVMAYKVAARAENPAAKKRLGWQVTIFVTWLLKMVNDLPAEKTRHAPKKRFLSKKSHKTGKNASWHGL